MTLDTRAVTTHGIAQHEAEIAIVEWIGWFNHRRLHTELGDIPPAEFEARHAEAGANPEDRSRSHR